MVRRLVHGALYIAATATLLLPHLATGAAAEELCSLPPLTYKSAKSAYPQVASALAELGKFPIAMWYSDRNSDYAARAKKLVATCPETSRLSVVVYGLPHKDCASGYSSSEGSIKTSEDYVAFITTLVKIIGDRKVLYVVEPDAIAESLTNKSCGVAAGYPQNLAKAIRLLSQNANAELYLDVGYWTLQNAESTAEVVNILKNLVVFGKFKGIALNTANYRSNAEIAALCTNFQTAVGSMSYSCVTDTSRNYLGSSMTASGSTEWCNPRTAGIGSPPTQDTGFANLDYFLWIKPPGDSDGKCDDGSHTVDSLQGPEAGLFFEFGFKILWNQGYFVNELKHAGISMAPETTAPDVCGLSGGACGNEELGAKCCMMQNEYCQPWTPSFYQCQRIDPKCGVQQVGREIEGEDLATYFGVLPDVCCDTCVTKEGCKAYTFVNQDSDHNGKSACYLKSGASVKRPLVGAVSAVLV